MPEHPLVPAQAQPAALVAPQPREAGRAPSSALVIVETERGSVFASLRYARIRAFALEFLLDVVNTGDEPILATTYASVLRGGDVPVEPYSIWIEPRSEAYVHLRMPPLAAMTCRAAVVRIQGLNVHQRLEARMPRPTLALGVGAGLIAAGVIATILSQLVPRASLDVAATAPQDSTVDARYTTTASTRVRWELDDAADGHRVDGATLDAPNGTVRVHLPAASHDHPYVLHLESAGRVGTSSASAPVVALAPPPPEAAKISALAVESTTVADGGTVRVHYDTNARSGTIAAVDAQGSVWAQTALAPGGTSVLQLPKFNRDKELQIRVTAHRDATVARAGVGVTVAVPTVAPAPSAAPQASASAATVANASPETISTAPPNNGRVMTVLSPVVQPGGLVLLRVNSHPAHLHVQLIGSGGAVVDQRDVPKFAGGLALAVPKNAQGTVTVVTSYDLGDSQQSEIARVTVSR